MIRGRARLSSQMLRGLLPALLVSSLASSRAAAQTIPMQQLLSNYIDQRFGMFIHYNMNTYHAGWGENRVAPTTFAPPNVDCHTFTNQWAAAARSAGMKFGLLTTKHHDGFALWPSRAVPPSSSPYGTTPYTISQSTVPTMDVVRCYVDSFRAAGPDPDLYFSIWDPNNGIGSQAGHNTAPGSVDWAVVGPFITTQITELLTNYGDIPLFVFDGYSWLTGHQQVLYQEIHALIRRLQPNTIIMDHNGAVPWEVDTVYFHGYIEDYACLWIQTLRQYFDNTGDKAFVESAWPVLTKQLALFLGLRQPSGLVRGREFVIFDNPLAYQVVEGATMNAFIYKALQDSAYLATALGRAGEAAGYQQNATDLGTAFNTALWDGTAYKASTTVTVSGARAWYANMIALAEGIVPADRAPGLRQGLLANAISLSNTLFPYTHRWLFQDLYDLDTAAAETAVLERIRTRWATTFGPGNLGMVTDESLGPRNFHNFGSAPAYFLAASVLGVTVDGPVSKNRIILKPRLGDLTSARGTVVTEHGLVPVSWTREAASSLTFSFTVPPGKRAQVILPNAGGPPAAPTLTLDGQSPTYAVQGRYVTFEVGPGSHAGALRPGS